MARRKVYGRRDRKIFRKTAMHTKPKNIVGHSAPRGGEML